MHEISGSLTVAALTIGILHTIAGPDHYLPFIAMARAGRWSLAKTLRITLLCGAGHVTASVLLGLIGVAMGIGVDRITAIETRRADWAAWLLVGFGLLYLVWGVRRAIRNRPHTHLHVHADGTVHRHEHIHAGEHLHVHAQDRPDSTEPTHGAPSATKHRQTPAFAPWVLFAIFLFGPCEALIPILMYPAAVGNYLGLAWVTILFASATLATMSTIVAVAYVSTAAIHVAGIERYGHAAAGFVLTSCGLAVMWGL